MGSSAGSTGVDPSAPVRLGLLGGFRLSVGAEDVSLPMNAQRLVCFLAIHREPLLRTFVSGSLWGESTDHRAGGSLRSALWRLRRVGINVLAADKWSLVLRAEVLVDLHLM